MSQHQIDLKWRRESADFRYESYNREHEVLFDNGVKVATSAAAAFFGKEGFIDPEEMLVAAYSSCHMLSFLAIAARKRLVVDSYQDHAVGYLQKNAQGKLAITRIELSPVVQFAGEAPNTEQLTKLHHQSHDECFIANSCKVEGVVHVQAALSR